MPSEFSDHNGNQKSRLIMYLRKIPSIWKLNNSHGLKMKSEGQLESTLNQMTMKIQPIKICGMLLKQW